jgi:hypothetical protein
MIPVRTRASNFVYRGPSPDIGDAWVERSPAEHAVYLDWQPSDEERTAIAAGGLIRLGIFNMEPIPPVSLNVSDVGLLGSAGAALRDRALAALKVVAPGGPSRIPPGFWAASSDIWAALQQDGALDPDRGSVPTLLGRPLMDVRGAPADTLTYDTAMKIGDEP